MPQYLPGHSTQAKVANWLALILSLSKWFDMRSSNLTSIHQFDDSASTWLRLQSFGIPLDDEPRVWTLLSRNLIRIQHEKIIHSNKIKVVIIKCLLWIFPSHQSENLSPHIFDLKLWHFTKFFLYFVDNDDEYGIDFKIKIDSVGHYDIMLKAPSHKSLAFQDRPTRGVLKYVQKYVLKKL